MKESIAKIIFIFIDILMIVLAIYFAFTLRESLGTFENQYLYNYLTFYPMYIILITTFAYEGIYTYRYDFWHESKIILKVLLFSTILVFAYLAMTKSIELYSRITIGFTFLFMALLIPIAKNIIKTTLFTLGLWQKKVDIYGKDPFLTKEIYNNPYLGYIKPTPKDKKVHTVFINSKNQNPETLRKLLSTQIRKKKEVIFIPIIHDYDLTHAHIYDLSNTRTNLIVYTNRLKSKYRHWIRAIYNYLLALLLLPLLLIIIVIISILIKIESPGPIFFTHKRVGKRGRVLPIIKFRSMHKNAEERLENYLKKDSKIREEWETNFKLKEDPRVTKVGAWLRKTSLDELPQIFNILKGQMYFVGPRPVIQAEIDNYYKEDAEYYFMVKPGITGLWQVSGRSNADYKFRIATDKWYVLNWSLWLDIMILIKTFKVVWKREGAY